ncbi:MAG: PAS domain-containing sensor histidine kinase [Candidatus Eisenbacteria bacterium]|nr:PAS domain-containing sensor histidine kinase [Candidatus Eisenbacteria bacterium]
MAAEPVPSSSETEFAPAEREDRLTVESQARDIVSDASFTAMLEAMPTPAVVLNPRRQIVAANRKFLEMLGAGAVAQVLSRRPGEAVGCMHAFETPGGCGTSRSCSVCGAVRSILDCFECRGSVTQECRIRSREAEGAGAFDFRVQCTFMQVNGQDYAVLAVADISAEKRRQVLERTFFHDVLNECGGVHGIAQLLIAEGIDPQAEREFKHSLLRISTALGDDIRAHRQMLDAERGELVVTPEDIRPQDLLEDVASGYRGHAVARDRSIVVEPCKAQSVRTDRALLRRILGNLVKNALEAVEPGETVTVSAEEGNDEVMFWVKNPGVMPEEVQLQVFQRSFSTKGGEGRGIGTYGVKLFGERYLGGRVEFVSCEGIGTIFTCSLPREGPAR